MTVMSVIPATQFHVVVELPQKCFMPEFHDTSHHIYKTFLAIIAPR